MVYTVPPRRNHLKALLPFQDTISFHFINRVFKNAPSLTIEVFILSIVNHRLHVCTPVCPGPSPPTTCLTSGTARPGAGRPRPRAGTRCTWRGWRSRWAASRSPASQPPWRRLSPHPPSPCPAQTSWSLVRINL